MRRLEKVLRRNFLLDQAWKKEAGNSYRMGQARLTFLSGAPESSIVGATASGLLEVDEAQDVTILKFDRDIAPMTASTCATRVFWGTAWTNATLLSRELRAAAEAEKADGIRRVFRLTADDVAAEVAPTASMCRIWWRASGATIPSSARNTSPRRWTTAAACSRLTALPACSAIAPAACTTAARQRVCPAAGCCRRGRRRTRYRRLVDHGELQTGCHRPHHRGDQPPRQRGVIHSCGKSYPHPCGEPARLHPRLRRQWLGTSHTVLHNEIRALALEWNARAVVVDATGVGAGLASFLERSLPGRVFPFTFNSVSKSQLGWDFLGIVDSGRWREPALPDSPPAPQRRHQQEFLQQLKACTFEVLEGAEQRMRWGVPEASRDAETGEILHDDWMLSAALCARLEKLDWYAPAPTLIIQGKDPLKEMEGEF